MAVISMSKNRRSEKPNYGTPSYSGYSLGPSVADREFDRARRAAFIQDILAPVRNQPADLLPFEEVRRKLLAFARCALSTEQYDYRRANEYLGES